MIKPIQLSKKYVFVLMISGASPLIAIPATFYNDAFHLINDDPQTRLPITLTIDWGECAGKIQSSIYLPYMISNHAVTISIPNGCSLFKKITAQLHGIGAGQGYTYTYNYSFVTSNACEVINDYKFGTNDVFDYHIEWVSDPNHPDKGYPKVWGNIRNNIEGKFLRLPTKIYQDQPA